MASAKRYSVRDAFPEVRARRRAPPDAWLLRDPRRPGLLARRPGGARAPGAPVAGRAAVLPAAARRGVERRGAGGGRAIAGASLSRGGRPVLRERPARRGAQRRRR